MKKQKMLIGTGASIFVIATILISPLGTPIVSAVQNIFMQVDTATDIQVGGRNVEKIVYQGQTVWEREPKVPPALDGTVMQAITKANCPTERITSYDARNGQNYYIQKLPDGQCWMLSNLRYAGGGDNTYGDVKTLTLRSSGEGDNKTAEYMDNTAGSTDYTNTTVDSGFYGYLYNWCAAMGVQSYACNTIYPSQSYFDTTISICPAGWRLPSGDTTGEYGVLNNAINGGALNTDAGIRNNFLVVYAGRYDAKFAFNGSNSYMWSSTVDDRYTAYTFSNNATRINFSGGFKESGYSVRCVAN